MTEKYVIVHRTHDPIQADLLGDLLRENGIAARVLGTRHGAAIGVGQNILQLHIEVPQLQAGAATDFLESFFESDGSELLREQAGLELVPEDDDGDEDDGDQDSGDRAAGPARPQPLRPLFAGGATLLLFGGCHLYARRPWTALVLATGQVMALMDIASMQWHTVATGLVMFLVTMLLDLGGGQVAVRSHNRAVALEAGPDAASSAGAGTRVSPARQLAMGALLVVLAGAVGALLGPRIPEPERPGQRSGPAMELAPASGRAPLPVTP